MWHTMQTDDATSTESARLHAVEQEGYLEAAYKAGDPSHRRRLPSGPSPEGAVRGAQIARHRRAPGAVEEAARNEKKPPTKGGNRAEAEPLATRSCVAESQLSSRCQPGEKGQPTPQVPT